MQRLGVMASSRYGRSLLIFVLTLAIYTLRAGSLLRNPSVAPYFVHLADAFVHGQVVLQHPPAWGYDLIRYEEQWYVAQQPLPALLLTPLVAILGVEHVSDVALSVFCGALSVALADYILGMTTPDLTLGRRNLLVLFFALGTVHFSLSVLGTVWFLGQIVTILFVWVFIGAVWGKKLLLAGAALGLILLGRPSIVPGALLFALGFWYLGDEKQAWKPRAFIRFFLPLAAGVIFLGWYNWVRFDSPIEFGYEHIIEAPDIKQRFLQYGNFSLVFLAENLTIAVVKPPIIRLDCLTHPCPTLEPDPLGMGLIWTSSVLLYALFAFRQTGGERRQNILLAISTLLVLLPSLLYHNPGSAQFGYRFLLDGLSFWLQFWSRAASKISRLPHLRH